MTIMICYHIDFELIANFFNERGYACLLYNPDVCTGGNCEFSCSGETYLIVKNPEKYGLPMRWLNFDEFYAYLEGKPISAQSKKILEIMAHPLID